MRDRGTYGDVRDELASPAWGWIGGGAVIAAAALIGVGLARADRQRRDFEANRHRYAPKHPGWRPDMTRAEQDAYWGAYYARRGGLAPETRRQI